MCLQDVSHGLWRPCPKYFGECEVILCTVFTDIRTLNIVSSIQALRKTFLLVWVHKFVSLITGVLGNLPIMQYSGVLLEKVQGDYE